MIFAARSGTLTHQFGAAPAVLGTLKAHVA